MGGRREAFAALEAARERLRSCRYAPLRAALWAEVDYWSYRAGGVVPLDTNSPG